LKGFLGSAFGREFVTAMAVTRANAAVAAMDEKFGFLIAGDLATSGNRLSLCPVNGRRTLASGRLDGPAAGVGRDMLITTHEQFLVGLV
jgi:hypothetical protein